jgi:hypothetical protein
MNHPACFGIQRVRDLETGVICGTYLQKVTKQTHSEVTFCGNAVEPEHYDGVRWHFTVTCLLCVLAEIEGRPMRTNYYGWPVF